MMKASEAGTAMKPEDYLQLRYSRQIVQEDDGSWRAEIAEFPGCFAVGDTDVEALTGLADVAYAWLESMLATGQAIPLPAESNEYSGRLLLRMGKTLHKKAALAAERDGASLNAFVVNALAECVGAKSVRKRVEPIALTPSTHHALALETSPAGKSVTIYTQTLVLGNSAPQTNFNIFHTTQFADLSIAPGIVADKKGYLNA